MEKKQRKRYMMEDALYKRIRKAVLRFVITVLYSVELIYEIHRYIGSHDRRLITGIILLFIIFGILIWFLFVSVYSLKKTMELLFEEIYETGNLDGRQEGVKLIKVLMKRSEGVINYDHNRKGTG